MRTLRFFSMIGFCVVLQMGCAEGPLWRVGSFAPWVRERWQAEEQIADTYFKRKRELNQIVAKAAASGAAERNRVAAEIGDLIKQEPILLVRLHATELLGKLDCDAAVEGLAIAAQDPDSEIRIAAAGALATQSAEQAITQLHEIVGSDTDVDVRLAATKALGKLNKQAAIPAISVALADSNPAVQFRATEALESITGQSFGADVVAWQNYLTTQGNTRVADNRSEQQIR